MIKLRKWKSKNYFKKIKFVIEKVKLNFFKTKLIILNSNSRANKKTKN